MTDYGWPVKAFSAILVAGSLSACAGGAGGPLAQSATGPAAGGGASVGAGFWEGLGGMVNAAGGVVNGMQGIKGGGGAASASSAITSMSGVVGAAQKMGAASAPPMAASPAAPANGDQLLAASSTTTTQPAPAAARPDVFSSAANVTRSASGINGSNSLSGAAGVIDAVGGLFKSFQ